MLSSLAMEVVPGVGLGPFQLGHSLWHVLDYLRSNKDRYPKVELQWDPEDPANSVVTVTLPPHLILYFPPSLSQRLQLIKIPELSKSVSAGLSLVYETQVIASNNILLTRASVGRVLGPTFDANASRDGKNDLHFPGISFSVTDGGRDRREDGVSSVIISQGSGPDSFIPETIKELPSLEGGLASCIIEPRRGATLHFHPRETSAPLEIIIGETTSQDLLLDLGPPLRKFWKEDERMKRMWGKNESKDSMDCFWNYFQHGLDFLIDEAAGTVKKIVVHSNIPGTPMFQRYARCPWSIATSPRRSLSSSSDDSLNFTSSIAALTAGRSAGDEGSFVNGEDEVAPKASKKKEQRKAETVKQENGTSMLLDRVGEGGLDGVIGVGTSRLIGLQGLVLEHEEKGGIGSVTVF